MLYAKLIDQNGKVLRLDLSGPAAAAGFDMENIRHAMLTQALGDGTELDLCGNTYANAVEIMAYLNTPEAELPRVSAEMEAAAIRERAEQPRERSVLCSGCFKRHTWNVNGRCDACQLGEAMHRHPAGRGRDTSDGQEQIVRFDGRGGIIPPLPLSLQDKLDINKIYNGGRIGADTTCPDCGVIVFMPAENVGGEDKAWKQHFDYCEPHQARIQAEEE